MTRLDRHSATASTDKGPLFVVGMWRSGTSLLYALLNQHPQIALMYEGDLPLLRPLFLGGKAKADWRERWEFWNSALSRHHVQLEKLPADVKDLPTAMELAYRIYAGDSIWGCKSPNYYDSMSELAREFPTARFIVIYRNPADICRSIVRAGRKASWFSRSGMPLRALLGYLEMKKETDRLLNAGIPVHVLQYEELVREPEGELRRVCRFLQIEFEPDMLLLANAERSAIYDGEHHAGVKSQEIRAAGNREEALDAGLKTKVDRYIHLWRMRYNDAWPLYRDEVTSDPANPSWMERLVDSSLYRSYRMFDHAVAFLYCFAPMSLLRMYRGTKSRGVEMHKQEQPLRSPGAD